MASIRPFMGLRYASGGELLDCLTAPPYDVLSEEDRSEYSSRSPHNIVHLTLPEQKEDDRSKFIKYARSAALLSEWRRDGFLQVERAPTIYRYRQYFTLPGSNETLCRTSIISLIKVEPYGNGVVLPHEQTFPKHKEDRMRILEATRSHLECIFGLYEDPSGEILQTISKTSVTGIYRTTSDDGVVHELEPIEDQPTLDRLIALMADKKVWIADGHHRYETALAFRQGLNGAPSPIAEDYMMMALCSISDPGLVLLPTHRIVNSLGMTTEEIVSRLSGTFDLQPCRNERLMSEIEAKSKSGMRAFGVALPGGNGYVLLTKPGVDLVATMEGPESEALKVLDVSVLHTVILKNLLGVAGLEKISYTRDAGEAVRAVEQGAAVAFLMNPPSVDDMKEIALGGEKMPQKSTYYYPKILSGLVIWCLNDFQ